MQEADLSVSRAMSFDRQWRRQWALPTLITGLCLITAFSLSLGALPVTLSAVAGSLLDSIGLVVPPALAFDQMEQAVITHIRGPRIVLGMLVGGALAISGAAMQGLFRNPLADPGLIGVSAGAAFAAACAIVLADLLLPDMGAVLSNLILPAAAFGGGLLATLFVYQIANRVQGLGPQVVTLLLAGIAINAVAGAGTGLLTYVADDEQLRTLTFWTMGSLAGGNWPQVGAVALFLGVACIFILRQANALNAMLLGESEAGHLGYDLEPIKRHLIIATAAAVGAAVAVSGMIGFVGLVVPHLLRLLIGPEHRLLLPASALFGALLLPTADLVARTLIAPAELPIGIITAIIGGPFFLFLLIRIRS